MEASMMQKYMSQLWHDDSLFIVALDNVGRVTYANKKTEALFPWWEKWNREYGHKEK